MSNRKSVLSILQQLHQSGFSYIMINLTGTKLNGLFLLNGNEETFLIESYLKEHSSKIVSDFQ